jgi:Zn-dependent peptidase ImmA (M78 family)
MSVYWERLSGRTDRFAVKLSLAIDPHDGAGADEATAASWGAFEIWIEGQNICAHFDQGELIGSVHWYLLPLLEWLVYSWDPLLHEERLPVRNTSDDAVSALDRTQFAPVLLDDAAALLWEQESYAWWSRHSIRAARDGGLFPNLFIRRLRDSIELSWDDRPIAGEGQDFKFLASKGLVTLAPSDVAAPLWAVSEAAAAELSSRNPQNRRLRDLLSQVRSLRLPDRLDIRVSWLAGLGAYEPTAVDATAAVGHNGSATLAEPTDPASTRLRAWADVVNWISESVGVDPSPAGPALESLLRTEAEPLVIIGSSQAALLFGAFSPSVDADDVRALTRTLVRQYDPAGDPSPMRGLISSVSVSPSEPAWSQGYYLAEQLLEKLDRDGQPIDVQAVLDQLGLQVIDLPLSDKKVRGVSFAGPDHRPTIVVNSRWVYKGVLGADRFTLAHELCHLVHDRGVGARLAVASGPWAPRAVERRANAFAAMFLMPPDLVAQTLTEAPEPIYSIDGIRYFANALRVSLRAAINHLHNLGIFDEPDRDRLLGEAPGP